MEPCARLHPTCDCSGGLALAAPFGTESKIGASIANSSHLLALVVLFGITFRAAFTEALSEPLSPRQALARDLLAKKRRLRRTLKETQPIRDAQHREVAKLKAINAEREAYVAAHGDKMTNDLKALKARFDAQKAVLDPIAAESRAATERIQAETEELKRATEAWKNRNKKAA